ncbi:MAG: ABC transporter substrate-binding protein [Alphaproteobacteria bacterium]
MRRGDLIDMKSGSGRIRGQAGRRAVLAGLMAATLPVGRARSDEGEEQARRLIEALAGRALTTLRRGDIGLKQRESEFRAILGDGFDLDFIGRFVMGRHWRNATATQQEEYLALFREFVLMAYAARFGGYQGEAFVVVGARRASDKDVVVATEVTSPNGSPIGADWRVRVVDGRPRIIDVAVEGVSMALNQRQEFDAVVARHGIDGLIAMLRARVGKVSIAAG